MIIYFINNYSLFNIESFGLGVPHLSSDVDIDHNQMMNPNVLVTPVTFADQTKMSTGTKKI